MGSSVRGKTRDTHGHSERVRARCREYQNSTFQPDPISKEVSKLPAVDLSTTGIAELRRIFNGHVDPVYFFNHDVLWLKRTVIKRVRTCSHGQYKEEGELVKIIGIAGTCSIVVEVAKNQPIVINSNVLVDPKDWKKVKAAAKK